MTTRSRPNRAQPDANIISTQSEDMMRLTQSYHTRALVPTTGTTRRRATTRGISCAPPSNRQRTAGIKRREPKDNTFLRADAAEIWPARSRARGTRDRQRAAMCFRFRRSRAAPGVSPTNLKRPACVARYRQQRRQGTAVLGSVAKGQAAATDPPNGVLTATPTGEPRKVGSRGRSGQPKEEPGSTPPASAS